MGSCNRPTRPRQSERGIEVNDNEISDAAAISKLIELWREDERNYADPAADIAIWMKRKCADELEAALPHLSAQSGALGPDVWTKPIDAAQPVQGDDVPRMVVSMCKSSDYAQGWNAALDAMNGKPPQEPQG